LTNQKLAAAGKAALLGLAASSGFFSDLFPDLSHYKLWLAISVFLATALGSYAFQAKDRFQDDRQRYFLDLNCQRVIADLRKTDNAARLNVMMVRGRHFDFACAYHMDGQADEHIKLGIKEGVAGAVLKMGTWAVCSFENESVLVLGGGKILDEESLKRVRSASTAEKTAHLKLIYSYPVRTLQRKGIAGPVGDAGDVFAVINIDSQRPDALDFYIEQGIHETLLSNLLPAVAQASAFILSP
jgi:hypothetical protein